MDNVNDVWLEIKGDILNIRNSFIPLINKSKLKCKWATKTVKKRRRAKRRAWDKYMALIR